MVETMKEMTRPQVLKLLTAVPKERKAAALCALVGHSRLRTFCFGYNYCGRCGQQLGDSLGSSFTVTDEVIQGHNGSMKGCNCVDNFKKITWRDSMMVKGWKTWTKDER